MNADQVERLAAATNALRPDWPIPSLRTLIAGKLGHRAYTDAAIALTWIATDPDTRTPARVTEAGPWWTVAVAASRTPDQPDGVTPRDRCPYHPRHPKAPNCPKCAEHARHVADRHQIAGHMATIRDAIRAARPDHSDDQDQPCRTTRSDAPPATNPHPEPASKSTSTANSGPATATESAATSPSAELKSPA